MSFDLNWLLTRRVRVAPIERLLSKITVDDRGCWNYTGRKDPYGYGVFKIGGRNLGAHKVSYILHNGDFDQSKLEMMHDCHNRGCVNPDHIKAGTHKENMSYPETRKRIRDSWRSSKRDEADFHYNVVGEKKGQTILFGSTYVAKCLGYSDGSISSSVSAYKGKEKYKGFKFSYKGVLRVKS